MDEHRAGHQITAGEGRQPAAEGNPASGLTYRYVFALSAVAALILGGQLLIQQHLSHNRNDARLVNLAGRQRMLSQKIAKHALAIQHARTPRARQVQREHLRAAVTELQQSHQALSHGRSDLHATNSPAIRARFDRLARDYQKLRAAAYELSEDPDASADRRPVAPLVEQIMDHEAEFLAAMNAIVLGYEQEAEQRVATVSRLEFLLLALALPVLLFEALFIFRPAVRRIRAIFVSLARANVDLQRLSLTDSLTGIGNRRRFDEVLKLEMKRAARTRQELSLLLIDIDHFKTINDTRGHGEGDVCLARIGSALSDVARRPADLAARYGGEEFALLLADTDAGGAEAVAEAVRKGVAQLRIRSAAPATGPWLTVSIGIATLKPRAETEPDALIVAADKALYEAKNTGRDRVVASPAPRIGGHTLPGYPSEGYEVPAGNAVEPTN